MPEICQGILFGIPLGETPIRGWEKPWAEELVRRSMRRLSLMPLQGYDAFAYGIPDEVSPIVDIQFLH